MYTGIPGYGLCQISPDLKTWTRIGSDPRLKDNVHGLVVFTDGDETLIALAQNENERVLIVGRPGGGCEPEKSCCSLPLGPLGGRQGIACKACSVAFHPFLTGHKNPVSTLPWVEWTHSNSSLSSSGLDGTVKQQLDMPKGGEFDFAEANLYYSERPPKQVGSLKRGLATPGATHLTLVFSAPQASLGHTH